MGRSRHLCSQKGFTVTYSTSLVGPQISEARATAVVNQCAVCTHGVVHEGVLLLASITRQVLHQAANVVQVSLCKPLLF